MADIRQCFNCGGKTYVLETREMLGVLTRTRACSICSKRIVTKEVPLSDKEFVSLEKNAEVRKTLSRAKDDITQLLGAIKHILGDDDDS